MTMGDKILRLLNAILDTVGLDFLIIALELFKFLHDVLRYLCLGELAHTVEAVIAEDWHDSWDDQTVDSSLTAVSNPVVENLIIKEELSDDEISTSINLLFEIANVVFSGSGLQMHLRVARNTDAEEVTVLLLDETYKV